MKKSIIATAIIALLGQMAIAQTPDAVYRLIRQEWTINADGTSDYHFRQEVEIIRNRALTAYADKGETFVVYNPELEEVTVNEVYTIQADGRRVSMPQNAFIHQLPAECADCGRYNNLRELAMVHTGMELGCTVVTDYTIHRRYNLINEELTLSRECPVQRLEVVVNYPQGQEFVPILYKGLEGYEHGTLQETHQDGKYSLVGTNLPSTCRDAYLPANYYPALHIFNGTPLWEPPFGDERFDGAQDAMGRTMASRDKKVKIEAARNYVVDYIHLNDIHPSHLGYTHASAAETWQSGCGTATDKAVLLAAILRSEGFNAHVVGSDADQVGIMLDTMEYRLSVRNKEPLSLYAEAKDEVASLSLKRTPDCQLDTLQDGFYNLSLAPIPQTPAIDARLLTPTRETPLASPLCDINVTDQYTLPAPLSLVGGKQSRKISYDGLGSVEVTVKLSGDKLTVERRLKLEQRLVSPADYAHYREIVALWHTLNQGILLKAK